MTFLWFVTGASLVVALMAWRQARRSAERLEQLTRMYWELKYQHGELRAQVQRGNDGAPSPREEPAQPASPGSAFIPLASLRR